jgi:cation diffusion facilitator CzcD-associated flavoprotein CzcO
MARRRFTRPRAQPVEWERMVGEIPGAGDTPEYDAVVIGAGVTGLYTLHRLRQAGFSVRVFEQGDGVGGVWYWNRYPGCRFDTYSPTYSLSCSQELLQEWDWKETYSPQRDNEEYLNFAADQLGLRDHIQLGATVTAATFNEEDSCWLVELADGARARCRFLVTAVGRFSARYVPDFPGLDSYQGQWVHTGRWPDEGLDLAGKRVAVVGTGATAVQVIPEIAGVVGELTVFQRTANYCLPLDNEKISDERMAEIKDFYPAMFEICNESPVLELDIPDPRSGLDVSREERFALYEKMWQNPGVAPKFVPLFHDVLVPGPINDEYSDFVREKIRARIKDPKLAEKLVPADHTFHSKRPPGESGYYEAFDRDNVELVDVREDPIESITADGIKTRDHEFAFDVIIFATGWDVLTGALLAMDIRGEGGLTLDEKFADGLRTYLFAQTAGFPNLFLINASVSGSFVRAMEATIDWMADAMVHVRDSGYRSIAPTPQAEADWTVYVTKKITETIWGQSSSPLIGANIPGKPRVPLMPPDREQAMRAKRHDEAVRGYPGFSLR